MQSERIKNFKTLKFGAWLIHFGNKLFKFLYNEEKILNMNILWNRNRQEKFGHNPCCHGNYICMYTN
jgi:hypothetical protein